MYADIKLQISIKYKNSKKKKVFFHFFAKKSAILNFYGHVEYEKHTNFEQRDL